MDVDENTTQTTRPTLSQDFANDPLDLQHFATHKFFNSISGNSRISSSFSNMKSVVLSILLLALSRTAVAAPGDLEEMRPKEYVPPPNRVDRDNVDEDAARNLRGLQTCFNFRWELWTPDGCNFDALVALMNRDQAAWGCTHDSVTELMRIFGVSNRAQVKQKVDEMCLEAFADKEERDGVTFGEILMQDNNVFPKAYFDGECQEYE